MSHRHRMALVLGFLVLGGAGTGAFGPSRLAAQSPSQQPATGKAKMPPAIALNTAAISGQVVGVMPTTLITARDSLVGKAPFTDRAAAIRWADSLIGDALQLRAPEVIWKLPAQLRSMAKRAPGIAADPDYMGQAALRNPQIEKVPDPLMANLRTLMALAGGRFVLVPASLSFQHDSTGAVETHLNLAGVDTRTGNVAFRSYIKAAGPTPAAALDSAMAILMPTVSVE